METKTRIEQLRDLYEDFLTGKYSDDDIKTTNKISVPDILKHHFTIVRVHLKDLKEFGIEFDYDKTSFIIDEETTIVSDVFYEENKIKTSESKTYRNFVDKLIDYYYFEEETPLSFEKFLVFCFCLQFKISYFRVFKDGFTYEKGRIIQKEIYIEFEEGIEKDKIERENMYKDFANAMKILSDYSNERSEQLNKELENKKE